MNIYELDQQELDRLVHKEVFGRRVEPYDDDHEWSGEDYIVGDYHLQQDCVRKECSAVKGCCAGEPEGPCVPYIPGYSSSTAKIRQIFDQLADNFNIYLRVSDCRHGSYRSNRLSVNKFFWAGASVMEDGADYTTEMVLVEKEYGVGAETMPLAICRAAVLAVREVRGA